MEQLDDVFARGACEAVVVDMESLQLERKRTGELRGLFDMTLFRSWRSVYEGRKERNMKDRVNIRLHIANFSVWGTANSSYLRL